MYGMLGLLVCFGLLSLVFWHGASVSLHQPRVSELEAEQYMNDAVYEAGKALLVGLALLIVGLAVF